MVLIENLEFKRLKDINEDFYGVLRFESGIIEELVVKGSDNSYYLKHDFQRKENSQGAVFVDSRYTEHNQIMVLYGHNVYYDKDARFSMLEDLMNQEVYEKNNVFYIDKGSYREKYKIVGVIKHDVFNSEFNYQLLNFPNDEYFEKWSEFVKSNSYINSINGDLKKEGKIVILQTCEKWNKTGRILIIAQEALEI